MLRRFAFLIALALLAAGCTSVPAETAASSGAATSADLVSPDVLAGYMPAPGGWRLAAAPAGTELSENGVAYVSVTATYLRDDANRAGTGSAEVAIQDTGGLRVGLRRVFEDFATFPAATPATLKGMPAFVLDDGAMAGACILAGDRHVVWLAVPGGTRGDLDAFVAAMDLASLAAIR